MAKTNRFEIRLSDAERTKLMRSASSAGVTPSEYLRSLINGKTVSVIQLNIDGRALDQALYELKKSGTNLNQLVHILNRGNKIGYEELLDTLEEHKLAAEKIGELIDVARPS